MAYWWVNHKQTRRAEVSGDFLWSPLSKKNGAFNQSYENMRLAEKGDIVFSYAEGRICHAGVVVEKATLSPKPDFGIATTWDDEGWLLPVMFTELKAKIIPKRHLDSIAPLLPKRHAPIRPDGNGNQSTYLAAIPTSLGEYLLMLGNADLRVVTQIVENENLFADLEDLREDDSTGTNATSKAQLTMARIGQGLFRRRVLALEPECRVTGVSAESFLRASHIKPWRESDNRQRLDGANGLMLAPHVDLLFDRHLISFDDDGTLLISSSLGKDIVNRWNISQRRPIRGFTEPQREYLREHRDRLI